MENIKQREDIISWNEYFINIAVLSAMRSKDPSCQVGACIVNQDNIICGIGYNGFPKNCPDNALPWSKSDDRINNKHSYVIHAEVNAILNKNIHNLNGCILYSTHFPCNECTKIIIQSGIKEILYLNDKLDEASIVMLDLVGIKYSKLNIKKIIIREI